ncbi:uncharacterized protein CTHT_0018110 [Thermochaetoides thermophila DSM 1495]|uniref:Uncharacterized protein n=1 Tax=Chaetomium thermophilum (strain DSM 1495 / CBS 144.50 / IMI 039719) TaxID=759272 RepID=G0S2Q7_CHATD|nr:hypothetical protein CTHT_0018110 [Thermochaetoides thermophila DSM 1495]EGS22290.1 hypothetical protein CTHT_0018110 [Thermochaetoides thermophila DSM 1495]
MAHHASLRVNQLCTKARGLGLRVDPSKTEVHYIPPPRRRHRSEAWQDGHDNNLDPDGEDVLPPWAAVDGRLVPSRFTPVWSSLIKVAYAALRVIFPVWRTIPTAWLWWLAGLYPEYLLDRERARWRARVEMLPANHPL